MKKYLIFASVVACLAVSGCVKAKKDFADDQVSFSASTGTLDTRTDYGVDETVGGQPVTYVNWVGGDKIKILSSTGSSDTYTVSEVYDGGNQRISKGNVTPDHNGIAWGTGTQTFYAMYPANFSGSSLTSSTMECVIPATWTPANETELGQLPYGYMFAKTTTTRTTSVSLIFDPKFTAFTFTLKNPTETAVTLSSFTLSSASKAMNGTYTVNTSNGSVGTLPTAESNKSVTVDFSSWSWSGGGLVIPACTTAGPGTKTFTLVTVPNTFDDLSISCTIDGVTTTRDLKKNGSFLSFAAGKKHNISMYLPGTAPVENPFTIMFGGGTESGKSAFETSGEQGEGTFYVHPISQGFNNENIKYLGRWSSLPTNGNHNALQVFSDYIAIQDRGITPAKGGIYFELSDTYNEYTPTKIEIECSAATGSKIKVYFNTDSASIPARINDVQDVYSSGESGKKVLIYTQSTTPSIPTTALKDIKIINTTSSLAAINIYSVKVYF